jgi:Tol biopolymer transport system component
MVLEIGTRLGPYEITGQLGTGGMGRVFKARDTRLDRTVAIKVSSETFTARFEREARAVAALNHPNICQLYDVGQNYLVLEHIAGTPIMPTDNVRKLLDVAVQIADGMAAAHEAGFVHRDLKPSNLLVTAEGRVKILDFGLVKSVTPQAEPGNGPALTVTTHGLVAGTTAYMSPEQARGEVEVDARSDQFSYGLVLYELATGKRPFDRSTGIETLAAIVRDDPAPLPSTVLAPLRWIIERCLAKEPRDRYASSRDLYLELKGVRDHLADASATQASTVGASSRHRPWRVATAFGAGALAVAAAIALLGLRAPQPSPALRFTPLSFEPGGQTTPVWSPDGRAVAFAAHQRRIEPLEVYVRYLDSPAATLLTRGARVAGIGLSQWTSSGQILFGSPGPPPGLWSISAVGGEPELAHEPLVQDGINGGGTIARDGRTVAVLRQVEGESISLWTGTLPGPVLQRYEPLPFKLERLVAPPLGFALAFSPDGRQLLLMWYGLPGYGAPAGQQAWLLPYPADAARPPRRILEALPAGGDVAQFSWMPDSRHIVVTRAVSGTNPQQLYLADTRSDRFRPLASGTTHQIEPAVSPRGDKLVFSEVTTDLDIVSLNLRSAAVQPLLATGRREEMPAWAAQRPVFAYVTDRNGEDEIWLHEEGRPDKPIVTARDFPPGSTQWFMSPALAPDASRVIYAHVPPAGAPAHVYISSLAGGAPLRLTTLDDEGPSTGSWSPDGRWYAYTALTGEGNSFALKKVRTTGQTQPEILRAGVLQNAAWVPVWSPDGAWILYQDEGAKLVSPDGKTTRDLGRAGVCTFARSADRLYCLRPAGGDGSRRLVSMDLEGGDERQIGTVPAEHVPVTSALNASLRLTLTPDGDSVTYSIGKVSQNLWLIEGLDTVALP